MIDAKYVLKTDLSPPTYAGDMAVDVQSNQILIHDGAEWQAVDSDANLEYKTTMQRRADAQAYLQSLGITEDINDILQEKYPEYLI